MAGLVPAICKPLMCIGPRHKAEDDGGEAAGLPENKNACGRRGHAITGMARIPLFRHGRACPGHLQAFDVYRSSAQGRG